MATGSTYYGTLPYVLYSSACTRRLLSAQHPSYTLLAYPKENKSRREHQNVQQAFLIPDFLSFVETTTHRSYDFMGDGTTATAWTAQKCSNRFQQIGYQPGMVANPARGQLNRKNGIWSRELGSAVPSHLTLLILQTQHESGVYLRDSTPPSRFPLRFPLESPCTIRLVPTL